MDDRIRVLFTRDQLDRRLRGIFDRNRTVEAETGVHTLQIAFGFLEWRETASSSERYYAPLLLDAGPTGSPARSRTLCLQPDCQ